MDPMGNTWEGLERSAPHRAESHDVIKYNRPLVGLGEKEAAVIAFGREMFGQRKVSSATFAEVLRLFGRRGTVDLVIDVPVFRNCGGGGCFRRAVEGRTKTASSASIIFGSLARPVFDTLRLCEASELFQGGFMLNPKALGVAAFAVAVALFVAVRAQPKDAKPPA